MRKDANFTFVPNSLPQKAGIDPFALLIDRVPDDNTKPVTLLSGTAPAQAPSAHAGWR